MELSFNQYEEWFSQLPHKSQQQLLDNDLSPEVVLAVYQAKREQGLSDRALKEFKTTIEYNAHYWSSPPHLQKQLQRLGIDGKSRIHDDNKVESNQGDRDVAESPLASIQFEGIQDDEVSEICEQFGFDPSVGYQIKEYIDAKVEKKVEKKLSDRTKTLVAMLLQEPNLRIAAGGLAFAVNLAALNGLRTQTAFALKIGYTRSAVSKSVRKWKALLELPTNAHMKSDKAIEKYRQAQHEKHWRKQTFTA